MVDRVFSKRCRRLTPVLASLVSFALSLPCWALQGEEVAAPEVAEPAFESFRKMPARTFRTKYRVGDYVVKHGRSSSKFDRKSDTAIYHLTVDAVAPTGAKAGIDIERKEYWGVDYPPDASFGEVVFDGILEATTGASIRHDSADEVLLRTVVSGTVVLTDLPDEPWHLEAEQRPTPTDESFGTSAVWGQGTLTNGVRTLEFVYRGASPWNKEECLQMWRARDERGDQCHARVTRIEEDGALLAWKDNPNDYNLRVGLDATTRLLLLAIFDVENR